VHEQVIVINFYNIRRYSVILKYCVFCKLTDKSIAKYLRRRSKDLKNELKQYDDYYKENRVKRG